MTTRWRALTKFVRAYTPNRHALGTPLSNGIVGFVAPAPTSHLRVSRLRLHAAMARTALISGASPELVRAQLLAAATSVDFCVDDATQGLEFSLDLAHLNGAERTALAGRIGAGLCDLYMDSLGYVWRDQASALIITRKPLADFLYEGGAVAGRGVALAEAKGSMQRRGVEASQRVADAAYHRQVAAYLGRPTPAGSVLHGYAVGLSAALGRPAYLCIAETASFSPNDPGAGDPGGGGPRGVGFRSVSLSTALGNYATALSLSGYPTLGAQVRGLRGGEGFAPAVADEVMALLEGQQNGFIGGASLGAGAFIEIGFALRVEPLYTLASQLSDMSRARARPPTIELPVLTETREDKAVGEGGEDGDFVQFADGLAVFQRAREAVEVPAMHSPEAPFEPSKFSPEEIAAIVRERVGLLDVAGAVAQIETETESDLAQEVQYRAES